MRCCKIAPAILKSPFIFVPLQASEWQGVANLHQTLHRSSSVSAAQVHFVILTEGLELVYELLFFKWCALHSPMLPTSPFALRPVSVHTGAKNVATKLVVSSLIFCIGY